MRPIRYELKQCVLFDVATGSKLETFDARAVREYENKGGFAGDGIASGGHSFEIATAFRYDFQPYTQGVEIEGVRFIIASRRLITNRCLGERLTAAAEREIALSLE